MKSASPKLLLLPLIFIGGCGSSTDSMNDLKAAGLAYHNFLQKHERGPKDVEDFKDQLVRGSVVSTKPDAPYQKIKDGQFVFLWNISDLGKNAPTSEHVLAYEKDAPQSGGWVLFVDGTTKRLNATEFGAAKRAKE
jgi:hypothetical protein